MITVASKSVSKKHPKLYLLTVSHPVPPPSRPWSEPTLTEALQLLLEDLPLAPDAPGGMVEYRKSLATSFFFKFYLGVLSRVSAEPLPPELESITKPFSRWVKEFSCWFTLHLRPSGCDRSGRGVELV